MKKARIALVGVSGFGNVHYEDIMRACKAGRADIICATVINQQEEPAKCAALRSMGCTVFDDAAEMFQSFMGKVDLCFLPVGIGFHAPMTIAALENGMNVVLEKPLTATVQEADAIIDASKRTGRFVAVAYQHMYQPQIKSIKQAIISGEIGALKTVRGIGLWPRGKAYYARNNWAGKLRTESGWALDSPVNNALAHYMNMVCYFGGETLDDMAQINSLQAGLYRANPEIENFDTGFIGMTTLAGVKLLFVTSHAPQSTLDPIVEAVGEKGHIRWTRASYTIDHGDGSTETVPMPSFEKERDNIMDAVFNRLESPDAFVFTPERARILTAMVNAAHASAPIVQVPREFVVKTQIENKDDERYVWTGIDEVMHKTFDEIRLPTTSDIPFCDNGSRIDPRKIKFFEK